MSDDGKVRWRVRRTKGTAYWTIEEFVDHSPLHVEWRERTTFLATTNEMAREQLRKYVSVREEYDNLAEVLYL